MLFITLSRIQYVALFNRKTEKPLAGSNDLEHSLFPAIYWLYSVLHPISDSPMPLATSPHFIHRQKQ